jgi:hypothetical protein
MQLVVSLKGCVQIVLPLLALTLITPPEILIDTEQPIALKHDWTATPAVEEHVRAPPFPPADPLVEFTAGTCL